MRAEAAHAALASARARAEAAEAARKQAERALEAKADEHTLLLSSIQPLEEQVREATPATEAKKALAAKAAEVAAECRKNEFRAKAELQVKTKEALRLSAACEALQAKMASETTDSTSDAKVQLNAELRRLSEAAPEVEERLRIARAADAEAQTLLLAALAASGLSRADVLRFARKRKAAEVFGGVEAEANLSLADFEEALGIRDNVEDEEEAAGAKVTVVKKAAASAGKNVQKATRKVGARRIQARSAGKSAAAATKKGKRSFTIRRRLRTKTAEPAVTTTPARRRMSVKSRDASTPVA
eukprot:TRINITY_DN24659_c0_g7_i1.p2 TRINITY_DN24659_c0_g7~~TRINITY_DN24659_c0_g7_i1.p2  ORF type:complete len:300 (-),score=97.98 TRINITY_DN24659_c0_g7_i1:178-1077(-)